MASSTKILKATAISFLLMLCVIAKKVFGQLYADDVSDGRCTNVPIAENFTSCLPFILTPQVYTVNFASNALYRNYAESFLGRPAQNQAELDAMCYTFAFIDALAIQTGYETKTNIRTVVPTQLDLLKLLPTPFALGRFKIQTTIAQSSGSTVANQYVTVDQVVWCDPTNVLIVRCVNGTRQDWKVVSIGDPRPWVLSRALQIVKRLGMPTENAVLYKSASNGGNCPDAPNIVDYTLQALENVGLPLPIG